jgi:hypothetical protein
VRAVNNSGYDAGALLLELDDQEKVVATYQKG